VQPEGVIKNGSDEHYVKIHVIIPKNITGEQRKLIERFAEIEKRKR
jgi:DnaJ-class molecular chaperone